MPFCPQCGYNLELGTEKFCSNCGYNLKNEQDSGHIKSTHITETKGDVFGSGFTGDKNIIAKDTKGNIFYFNIGNVSTEQFKNIITSSTLLDASSSYKSAENTNIRNLNKVTETKQQTNQVLDEINRIEKKEGKEIKELKIGDLQITKNELSIKDLILKGNERFYKNEYDESIQYYDKALEIKPDYVDALNNKGNALDNLGKSDEAIKCCDKALEIKPDDADVWNNKGNALDKLGDLGEAIKCYDKALEIKHDDADAWYNKGNALDKLGDLGEAIKCYDKSLEIQPYYADALNSRQLTLEKLEKNKDNKGFFSRFRNKDKGKYFL